MKKSSGKNIGRNQASLSTTMALLFFSMLVTFVNFYIVWTPLWVAGWYRNHIEPSPITFFNNIGGLVVILAWNARRGRDFEKLTRLKVYIPVCAFFLFSMVVTLSGAASIYKDYFSVHRTEALVTISLHLTGIMCAVGTDFWLHRLSKFGHLIFKDWSDGVQDAPQN